jgi:hypothetical protein
MVRYFARSWALIKYSLWVLNKDRELLVFPILSLLSAVAIIVISFAGFIPVLDLSYLIEELVSGELGLLLGFLFFIAYGFSTYIVMTFGIIFFNAALTGAVLIRLEGRNPTLMDGLNVAGRHIGQIFKWAIMMGTVGFILNVIHKSGWLGRILFHILNVGWGLLTFFAIPLLVTRDNLGPFDAVRESGNIIKKTFGESVIGDAGVAACFLLPYFIIGLTISDFSLMYIDQGPLLPTSWVLYPLQESYLSETYLFLMLLFLITFVFHSTLFSIFRACLYQFTIDKSANGTAVAYGEDPNMSALFAGSFREK